MRKLAIATLALGALATFVTPATAAEPGPADFGCGFASVTDPNPEAPANTQTGEIDGGPLLQNGTITCTIQVNGDSHDDPNNGASASATGTNGFTYLSPTLVSYTATPLDNVYLCSVWTDTDARVWYYDGTAGVWVEGGASVDCSLAISGGTGDPIFDPVFELLDTIFDTLEGIEKDVIDPLVCPVLAILGNTLPDVPGVVVIEGDGDVYIADVFIWDCPPYVP